MGINNSMIVMLIILATQQAEFHSKALYLDEYNFRIFHNQ
jgi:hypothetical protein